MVCQVCGKNPATVHFTEIHDNKMSEIHVCERCAEEKGLQASAKKHKFEIADLLAGMVDGMTSTEEERVGHVQCPRCGLLYSGFKETGRLGCSGRAARERSIRLSVESEDGWTDMASITVSPTPPLARAS